MVMPKLPKKFFIDTFDYKEYTGLDSWNEPEYAKAITVENCRIDRGAEYTSDRSGKHLLYNALVLCYEGITTPMPQFTNESIIVYDDVDHVITKVIPIYDAFSNTLYAYELEVI